MSSVRSTDAWAEHSDRYAVHIGVVPGEEYPGIGMREVSPDWTGYETLVVDIFGLDSQPVQGVLRIHDFQHHGGKRDRFNRRVMIQPGFQTFRVSLREIESAPERRRMDMRNVAGFKLFFRRPDEPINFLTSDWRLE